MSESKATPRPWQVEHGYVPYDGGFEAWITSADGAGVCIVDCPPGNMEANAQLIVTAVNAHDDLLAACEAAYSLLRKLGGKNHDPEFSELGAVIAKARGEK